MGICGSNNAYTAPIYHEVGANRKEEKTARDRSVELQGILNDDHRDEGRETRLLLLGAPKSGKTTWKRHMHAMMATRESRLRGDAYDLASEEKRRAIKGTSANDQSLSWQEYMTASRPLVRRYTIALVKGIMDILSLHGRTISVMVGDGDGDAMTLSRVVNQLRDDGEHVRTEVATAIQAWWRRDDTIHDTHGTWTVKQWLFQYTHDHNARYMVYPFTDSMDQFMSRFATITSDAYKPDDMDVVLCPLQHDDPPSLYVSVSELSRYIGDALPNALLRITTSYVNDQNPARQPISEIVGTFNDWHFRWIDVHQERCSRRKWIHCFERVQGIVVFVSLLDYNRADPEGEYQTAMGRYMAEFHTIVETSLFRNTAIYLIFTHFDAFEYQLALPNTPPIEHYWPSYRPSDDPRENKTVTARARHAFEYFANQFCDDDDKGFNAPKVTDPSPAATPGRRNPNRFGDRVIFRYLSELSSQDNVHRIFDAMAQITVHSSLSKVG